MNDIKEFLRALSASLAAVKMYPVTHPQAKEVLDKTFTCLQQAMQEREELVIGIIEGEIVLEKEVLFDISAMLKLFIKDAKDKGIEKIYISRGIQFEELTQFIGFLALKKGTVKGDAKELLTARGVVNIRVSSLTIADDTAEDPKITRQQTYESILTQLTQAFAKLSADALSVDNVQGEIKLVVLNIMENLLGKYQGLVNFAVAGKFDPLVIHSLNVSLLSMHFVSRLGFTHDHVLETGVAAIVHDIGRFYSAGHQAQDGETLPPHTRCGAELILRYVDKFGPLPVIVALEHHLPFHRREGKMNRRVQPSHLISRIIKICDVYDVILCRRNIKHDYSPLKIYQFMTRGAGRLFDPQVVEKFFKIIGVWPRGTIVRLSDGRVAIVREENEDDILLPKVELLNVSPGQPLLDLRTTKETIFIKDYLSPLTDGQEYVQYI